MLSEEIVAAGLLFDLDGTLVDSTAVVDRNWRWIAQRLGRPADELVGRHHGVPADQALRMIDPELSEEDIHTLSTEFVAAELADVADVVEIPGASRRPCPRGPGESSRAVRSTWPCCAFTRLGFRRLTCL